MVTDAQRQQFREQGYFILDGYFSADEMDALTQHIDVFAEAHEQQLKQEGQQGISRPNEISFTAHLPSVIRTFSSSSANKSSLI